MILFKAWLVTQKQWFKFVTAILITVMLLLLMVLQSRTAVLATATGALYVSYPFLRSWYSKQKIVFVGLSLLALALVVLSTTIKTGSSAGRSFIWKNSLQLLRENGLKGVGFGRFNPAYNHIQAQYFADHSITDSIALRANDGYYAFNEWLQIWIETGVAGFLIFSALTASVVFLCFKNVHDTKQFYGPVLIPLLVACVFSYPLRNLPLLFIGILFCLIAISEYFGTNSKTRYSIISAFILVAIILIFNKTYAISNRTEVRSLVAEGFITEAYQICQNNIKAVHKDNNFSPLYLDILYNTGRLKELFTEFNKIHRFHCNQSLHSIVGKAYNEMDDSANARRHFLTALFIAPYRLQSRMDLLEFYRDKSDTVNARYWAQQIVDCPMKVITGKGVIIKQKAEEFLATGDIVPGFRKENLEMP